MKNRRLVTRKARASFRRDKRRRRAERKEIQCEAAPEDFSRVRGCGDIGSPPLGAFYGQALASSKIEDLTIHLADLERLSLPEDATPEALIPLLQLLPPSLAKEYQDPVILSPRPRRPAKGVRGTSGDSGSLSPVNRSVGSTANDRVCGQG